MQQQQDQGVVLTEVEGMDGSWTKTKPKYQKH